MKKSDSLPNHVPDKLVTAKSFSEVFRYGGVQLRPGTVVGRPLGFAEWTALAPSPDIPDTPPTVKKHL